MSAPPPPLRFFVAAAQVGGLLIHAKDLLQSAKLLLWEGARGFAAFHADECDGNASCQT